MLILKVKDKEYKVKFGYNSFCDTDLMERTIALLELFHKQNVVDDKDVSVAGKVKDLFSCVRDLLYVGFEKFNPVERVQDIGDILDDYHDEAKEKGEKRGILDIFTKLVCDSLFSFFIKEVAVCKVKCKYDFVAFLCLRVVVYSCNNCIRVVND